ncbi:hypothetical protein [Phytoactinopolyspora halotolerans]|uniref:Abortive infection protein n=1 Tax=Phytoactinopolyspora halotolerans TaxID=1981512 RepID=A0A6L9SBH0_9ACTN|nr:hypothetical protein [Phytoactinopolyspora halotolerans]NEE02413.1 hypothetical protein [Phytoactinopolyspora halotolerans]
MNPQVKGISYVVGDISTDDVRRDLSAIRNDLHCTTVMLIGTDTARQMEAAQLALEAGLDVYIRPYLEDRPRRELLAHLATTATEAEKLRESQPDRVTLVLGAEFSLTSPGMIPGPKLFIRLQVLLRWRRFFDRRITRKLNALLTDGVATARRHFRGPITYAAGHWENVDWSRFDLVGVNLYRIGADLDTYEQRLRDLLNTTDKPVVITEFGCGAHIGAELRGPGSFRIVNWFADPPHVKDGHVRDEQTQATYLSELIELYARHNVHGCFVYTFSMHDFPHTEDPRHDLDMAGFGVVKTSADDPSHWEPKEAFHEVARRYSSG